MASVTIKKGDIARKLTDTLTVGGAALNLTGATEVRCLMRNADNGALKFNSVAAIVDAVLGKVEYVFGDTDTDSAGRFRQEWKAIFPTNKPISIPDNAYNEVVILDTLA